MALNLPPPPPSPPADEAARIFDKAAVRVRGDKARLNFRYRDYTGDDGHILEDPQVGSGGGAGAKGGRCRGEDLGNWGS